MPRTGTVLARASSMPTLHRLAIAGAAVAVVLGCGGPPPRSDGAVNASTNDGGLTADVATTGADAGPSGGGSADAGTPTDAGATTDAGGTTDTGGTTNEGGSSGGTHEPAGMSVQIDTGALTAPPAATGTWTNGKVTFTMFSPVAMTATGESSSNLIRVPNETGLRLLYAPTLDGGNSPVRFGTGIASAGSTTYYQRWRVRTVPNWAGPRNGNGVKMCEPRALDQGAGSGAGTNDILMMWPTGGNDDQMSAMEALQGPDGHFRNMGVNQGQIASLTDGQWHVDERIYVAESTAGAGDGHYDAYFDGVLVAKYTDVLWLAPGGTWGINYWMVDPTFGGAPASTHPLVGDFWDFDQLYVSTK
jgi:hypothetical protein